MGVLYMPFFDVTKVFGLGSMTLATAGESNIIISLDGITATAQDDTSASPIFAHRLGSLTTSYIRGGTGVGTVAGSVKKYPHYARVSFASALQSVIQSAATTETWPTPEDLLVVFDPTLARYTISYGDESGPVFSITWSNAVTRNMLGFSGNVSGSNSYTGTKTPLYCINSTLEDVAHESPLYEPPGIANHLSTDDGGGTGIARTESPKWRDWEQTHETKLKTFRVLGAQPDNTSDPFTHEHLFEYCRGARPFCLYYPGRPSSYGVNEVYCLRTEGTHFTPKRAAPGHDDMFHIPYQCVRVGVVDGVLV